MIELRAQRRSFVLRLTPNSLSQEALLKEKTILALIKSKVFCLVQMIAFNCSVESHFPLDRKMNEVLGHYYFPEKYVESPFCLD